MADIIQIRRDTAANWTSANPTLAQGELGLETDTSKIKAGDGSTAWTSLGYLIDTGSYLLDSNNLSDLANSATALTNLGLTATATELNYVDGVTSSIQTQLNNKEPADATILKDADIGSTVQAYDATIVVDADIGVTVQAYDANTTTSTNTQTLTNKTIRDTVYALSGVAFDATNGAVQTKTLAANTTFTDSLTSGDAIVLQLEAGASYTVTWPTMTWVTSGGNVAPTLTAKDTLVFWKVSTTLYGAYTGSYV
jgi:hypothetical protein